MSFLLRPSLKNVILPRLPKICKNATKISAVLKLTKKRANCKNIVEEPKPAVVPIISAINTATKKKNFHKSILILNKKIHLFR